MGEAQGLVGSQGKWLTLPGVSRDPGELGGRMKGAELRARGWGAQGREGRGESIGPCRVDLLLSVLRSHKTTLFNFFKMSIYIKQSNFHTLNKNVTTNSPNNGLVS